MKTYEVLMTNLILDNYLMNILGLHVCHAIQVQMPTQFGAISFFEATHIYQLLSYVIMV